MEPSGRGDRGHPSRRRRHLHLAPGRRAEPRARPPLPARPALPTCQVSPRPAGRGPGEGQGAGPPRSCPRPVGRGLESGFQLPPSGTRVTPVASVPPQSPGRGSSRSPTKSPWSPGRSSGGRVSRGGAAQGSPTWASRSSARSRVPNGPNRRQGRAVAGPGNFPRRAQTVLGWKPRQPEPSRSFPAGLEGARWSGRGHPAPCTFPGALPEPELRPLSG